MGYDYDNLLADCKALTKKHPFIREEIIGKSVMKKPIIALRVGSGDKKLFINCAHHGLEYLTSAFIMRFLEEYAINVEEETRFFGYDACDLFKRVGLFVVPMVNPDGVDIAVNGLDITNPFHQKLISMVGIHSFNRVWQANARGVDINHNYNALWHVVDKNPSPTKYAGPYSESEPETKSIIEYVRENNFDMLIAFHSQGREIYYDFDGMTARNTMKIAEKMAAESGYAIKTPVGSASFGGCKDWFIKEFGKAGFTVEIGMGKNPLPMEQLDEVYPENAKLILGSMQELLQNG